MLVFEQLDTKGQCQPGFKLKKSTVRVLSEGVLCPRIKVNPFNNRGTKVSPNVLSRTHDPEFDSAHALTTALAGRTHSSLQYLLLKNQTISDSFDIFWLVYLLQRKIPMYFVTVFLWRINSNTMRSELCCLRMQNLDAKLG